jgi:hypothetical protein
MRASLLLVLLLAANPAPQWLFTIAGCRYLPLDGVEAFNTQMDHDLRGCTKTTHPLADIYKCGDGGAYMIFWNQPECDAAVNRFHTRHPSI